MSEAPLDAREVAARRLRLAPWIAALALLVLTVAAGAVVVDAVQRIAEAFLAPPPLASTEWVQRIVRLSSQELAFGIATGATATAAGGAAVIALTVAAIRRGIRIVAGTWLLAPAILGALLVIAAVRLAQQDAVTPTFDRVGVTGLLTSSDARGIPSLAVTLGWAGVLVLAGVIGVAAVASRIALIGCAVLSAALTVATVAAVVLAASPVDALLRAPAYPARTIEPDPFLAAMAPVLGLGAGILVVVALAAAAVRARRAISRV